MNKTILIIDENPQTLELLRRFLGNEGYNTVLADDGEKGMRYIRRYLPDLVLLERLLPKLNGLQVCKKIRENETTRRVPIIFLTILGSETDIIDGLKAGADDYMRKPFSLDELSARIERVLARYSEPRMNTD